MNRLIQFLRNSVRGRLAFLILATTVPAMLLVALLVLQAYRNERASVGRHLTATARALAALVDHRIGQCEALLKGLAISPDLESGNLAAFGSRLREIVPGHDQWIVLTDATGQQLVNTLVSADTSLPQIQLDGEFKMTLEQGRTYVSNLATGPLIKLPVLYVSVPVMQRGRLRYILHFAMLPAAFSELLNVEQIAPDIVVAIIDREGTIAARNPNGERYVGATATPDIVDAVRTRKEGLSESVTLEGLRVLAAVSRASFSGWNVALGAPYASLYASTQRLLWLGLVASALLMAIAILMATWIGRAVVRSVDTLVADTELIGRGAIPTEHSSGLSETDFVARAMLKSARRLREREGENAKLTLALQTELEKQKRAEEASRRLAAIVESSDDAIISQNLAGIVLSWNKGAEKIYGYSADEIVGRSAGSLIPPDRTEEQAALFARIQQGEHIEHFETVRLCKVGDQVQVSLTVSPLRDHEGKVYGASKIARDITQRKRTESQQHALYELAASVNRAEALPEIYDAALAAMCWCQNADRAAILLADATGTMRFRDSRGLSPMYRRTAEGHLPWSSNGLTGQPEWIDDVENAGVDSTLQRIHENEGVRALAFVPLTYERRLLGAFMIYYHSPHHFEPTELRPVEAIASQVAFAIERQKSAEALEALVNERTSSLRQAIAQMEEFSYSVSHDLRSPVRAMGGYVEAVLEDYGDRLDEPGRELLRRVLENSARMDRLIQDLLTYTRISRREVSLEVVSLDKLVRDVIQQYPDLRPEKADIAIEGPLPDVIGHEPSLTQVISNLLNNAVKFVAPAVRPRVLVRAERTATARIRLWFQDNGIGIRPEYQPRLFGMFERVHVDKRYEGTGIGLAIVRKAMERMNGTVGVQSDGVSGSTFWIELPAPRAPATDGPR